MASKKNHLITIEIQPKVIEIIDKMVNLGIYGRTRSDVVERGFCDFLQRKASEINCNTGQEGLIPEGTTGAIKCR